MKSFSSYIQMINEDSPKSSDAKSTPDKSSSAATAPPVSGGGLSGLKGLGGGGGMPPMPSGGGFGGPPGGLPGGLGGPPGGGSGSGQGKPPETKFVKISDVWSAMKKALKKMKDHSDIKTHGKKRNTNSLSSGN